jgi:nitrite reductase (NADH) large subunit
MPDTSQAWRCSVCGYIHRGPRPPEICPVCGSPQDLFEPHVESAPSTAQTGTNQWRCLNCGYVHDGVQPPTMCPSCGAMPDRFEPLTATTEIAAVATQSAKVLVIGAGIAGISAVESLRAVSPGAEIVLISKESELPYYRLNLTRFLAGEISEQDLPIQSAGWYEQQNVQLMLGAEAIGIHLDDRIIELRSGEKLPFNKLLLATGAHPFVPSFPGSDREGVTTLRTINDAHRILAACHAGAKCVCIGGGLLGVETAGGLARRGADVTLLEGHEWLLPRQLNRRAGEILGDFVAAVGIKLRTKAITREILGNQRVRGVLLEDGSIIPADLVVIATGVRPNSHLARQAGLNVNQGVLVNNRLATSQGDVFAAGDAAEHLGQIYGTWAPAQYQGNIAGLNLAGGNVEFGGIPRSNTLKVMGLDLFSIGPIHPEDASCRAVEEERDGRYFLFVFRDNNLTGSVLLGDSSLTGMVKKAVEGKRDFSKLLATGPNVQNVIATLTENSG